MRYLFILLLTGCAQFQAYEDLGRVEGAAAYDKGVEVSIFYLCNAASIGSVRRRFGAAQESAEFYAKMCGAGLGTAGEIETLIGQ